MKLATPKLIKAVTLEDTPKAQYQVLVQHFRLNPYFKDGVIVISEEAIQAAFTQQNSPAPRLRFEA